jgi:hypothetical protein
MLNPNMTASERRKVFAAMHPELKLDDLPQQQEQQTADMKDDDAKSSSNRSTSSSSSDSSFKREMPPRRKQRIHPPSPSPSSSSSSSSSVVVDPLAREKFEAARNKATEQVRSIQQANVEETLIINSGKRDRTQYPNGASFTFPLRGVKFDNPIHAIEICNLSVPYSPYTIPINANLYFSETTSASSTAPTMFRLTIPPGMYTGTSLVAMLNDIIQLAVPITDGSSTITGPYAPSVMPPENQYTFALDASTGFITMRRSSGTTLFQVHCPPQKSNSIVSNDVDTSGSVTNRSSIPITSVQYLTSTSIRINTGTSAHNIGYNALLNIEFRLDGGGKVYNLNKYGVYSVDGSSTSPTSNSFDLFLPSGAWPFASTDSVVGTIRPIAAQNSVWYKLGFYNTQIVDTINPILGVYTDSASSPTINRIQTRDPHGIVALGSVSYYNVGTAGSSATKTVASVETVRSFTITTSPAITSSQFVQTPSNEFAGRSSSYAYIRAAGVRIGDVAIDLRPCPFALLQLRIGGKLYGQVRSVNVVGDNSIANRYMGRINFNVTQTATQTVSRLDADIGRDRVVPPFNAIRNLELRLVNGTDETLFELNGAEWQCEIAFRTDPQPTN